MFVCVPEQIRREPSLDVVRSEPFGPALLP